MADPGEAHARQLSGIRGLRLTVEAVQAKLKYGGNVDDAHRAVAAEHLAAQGLTGALGHLVRRTPPA